MRESLLKARLLFGHYMIRMGFNGNWLDARLREYSEKLSQNWELALLAYHHSS